MNNKTKESITLMPEQQRYMVMKLDDMSGKAAKGQHASKLVKTGKTEIIAGYKAEEWAAKGSEHKTSIWGTKELGGWVFNGGPKDKSGLDIPDELKDGSFFMLRVVGENGGGIEATKVEKKSVDSRIFEVPAGYEKMDMGAMMGAGMTDAQKRAMFKSMQNMTPQQKAMMQKMMKGKGGE